MHRRRRSHRHGHGLAHAGGSGERGFSLVELLVAMGIIGILAAIAIPVINAQRGKAGDTATRQDVNRLGKYVTGWFLEKTTPPTLTLTGGRYVMSGEDLGAASVDVVVAGSNPTAIDSTGWTATAWCFALTNPVGVTRDYRFSAQNGLEPGTCTSPTQP